jgi:curved DNA-binding protein CbpA
MASPQATAAARGDHYGVLGVARGVAHKALLSHVKRLLLKVHPDKGGDGATAALVNTAADVLKDPVRRAAYDSWLLICSTQVAAAREAEEALHRARAQEEREEEALRKAARKVEEARREVARQEEEARRAVRLRASLKKWRRRKTKELHYPFVPKGHPQSGRMPWVGRAEATRLRDEALAAERSRHFPRCSPKLKRERPEVAEAVQALHKRHRAATARCAYYGAVGGPRAEEAAGEMGRLSREAWRLQGL